MSAILPWSSQHLSPHRRASNSISAIRHVQFRRPTVDHGKKHKRSIFRRKKKDTLPDGVQERSEASSEDDVDLIKKIGWRQRIEHFTWTWFTMTMATGGIANVMYVSGCLASELNCVQLGADIKQRLDTAAFSLSTPLRPWSHLLHS